MGRHHWHREQLKIMSQLLKKFSCALLFLISVTSTIAQVADPSYANMQRAVGGIIQQSAQSRGFSTSDPRTYSTMYAVGKTAVAGAAGVGTGLLIAGTSPAWGSVLAFAAISGAVSYGVGVAIDGVVKWLFSPTNVTVSGQTNPSYPSSSVGTTLGQSAYTFNYYDPLTGLTQIGYAGDPLSAIQSLFNCTGRPQTFCSDTNRTYFATCTVAAYATCNIYYRQNIGTASVPVWSAQIFVQSFNVGTGSATATCPQGTFALGAICKPITYSNDASVSLNGPQTITQASSSLTPAQNNQPVNYDTMAMMINNLWRSAASQTGYAGIPYSTAQPVTSADVQAWAQANPSSYPTVRALTTPVTSPPTDFAPSISTGTSTAVQPATSSLSPTSTNPAQASPQINLGPDPNIGAPTLEATPTAQSIFQPFLSLVQPIMQFNFNAPLGVCPRPAFDVFGTSVTMTSHCDIAEDNRSSLNLIMMLCYTIIALFIIFKA
jgi:hypothetical protein